MFKVGVKTRRVKGRNVIVHKYFCLNCGFGAYQGHQLGKGSEKCPHCGEELDWSKVLEKEELHNELLSRLQENIEYLDECESSFTAFAEALEGDNEHITYIVENFGIDYQKVCTVLDLLKQERKRVVDEDITQYIC